MKADRNLPRIGGLPVHPLADGALPLLTVLSVAIAVGMVAALIQDGLAWFMLTGFGAGLAAFLVAMESYLFTTVFYVREFDMPRALRWVEMALMAVAIKVLATLPGAAGLLQALVGGGSDPAVWAGLGLLAYAWNQGRRLAEWMGPLHPHRANAAPRPDQEVLMRDDHADAFAALCGFLLAQAAGVALVAGAAMGGPDSTWGVILLVLLALLAVLVGARLRQEITWALEGLTPPPTVTAGWFPRGVALLLMPVLAALLLPAGPRLPVASLVRAINEIGPQPAPVQLEPPQPEANPPLPPELAEAEAYPWIERLGSVLAVVGKAAAVGAAVALAALVLRQAARELADRVGRRELRGIWTLLAVLARWYLTLLALVREWFGVAVREAVSVPVRTVGAALGDTGAIGRYLPFLTRPPTDPRGAVRFYFRRLKREATRRGLGRKPGTTAAELVRQVAEAAPEHTGEAEALRSAYERARYSDLPVTAEHVFLARRAWAALARAIRIRQ